MKINELIKELEEVKEEHGNLEVAVNTERVESNVKNLKEVKVYAEAIDLIGDN